MAIDTTCPGCGRTLRVDDSFAGRKARCPMCKHVYSVPPQGSVQPQSIEPSLQKDSWASRNDSWENYDPRRETAAPSLNQSSDLSSMGPSDIPMLKPFSSSNTGSSESNNAAPLLTPTQEVVQPETNPLGSASLGDQYYVRVPNGQVYGPSNATTLKEWASQGRINNTCDVRPANTELWISYSAWLIQQNERSASSQSSSFAPATRNIYGDNFGGVATPSNQTPSKQSGLGILICCLGVASWFLCFSFIGAPICAVVTVVLAVGELKKIAEGRSPREERALVHIGLWLSVANLAISLVLLMLFFVLVAISP